MLEDIRQYLLYVMFHRPTYLASTYVNLQSLPNLANISALFQATKNVVASVYSWLCKLKEAKFLMRYKLLEKHFGDTAFT